MAANLRTRLRAVAIGVACLGLVVSAPSAVAKPGAPKPPKATAAISGVVYDHLGTVLPGAKVTLYALPGLAQGCPEISGDDWSAAGSATTTSAGTYSIPVQPGGYRIGVTPASLATDSFGYRVDNAQVTSWVGWAGDVFVGTAGRSGINVHLTAPASITGTVYESAYPVPEPRPTTTLAGMLVRAVNEYSGQTQRIAPETLTLADGTYTIAGLPTAVPDPILSTPAVNEALQYGLVLSDPTGWHGIVIWWHTMLGGQDSYFGFELPTVDLSAGAAQTRDAWLEPSSRITGVVTNAKGRPVAGVFVDYLSAFPWPPVQTDAKGRYAITAMYDPGQPAGAILRYRDESGAYREVLSGGVQWAAEATPVLVPDEPGHEVVANVTLPGSPATITGAVWYAAGVPASDAWVGAYNPDFADPNSDWSAGIGSVACDGSFRIVGLWPGAYTVWLGADTAMESRYVTLAEGQTASLGTVLLPSGIVQGQVVEDATGESLAGIQVDLYQWLDEVGDFVPLADAYPGWWSGYASARDVTDGNGQFRVFSPSPCVVVGFHDPLGRVPDEYWPDQPAADSAELVCDDNLYDNQAAMLDVGLGLYVRGVTGTVLDSSGQPAPVTVVLRNAGDWSEFAWIEAPEGTWAFTTGPSLAAIDAIVEFRAPWGEQYGWYSDQYPGFLAPAYQGGENATPVRLAPQPPDLAVQIPLSGLTGVVTPAAGVAVTLEWDLPGGGQVHLSPIAYDETTGAFTFEVLGPGASTHGWKVRFDRPGSVFWYDLESVGHATADRAQADEVFLGPWGGYPALETVALPDPPG